MMQPTARPALEDAMTPAPAARVMPEDDPYYPHPARIDSIHPESPGVATLRIEVQDRPRRETYRILPGQFNMLYLPCVGEVPVSVSGIPREGECISHTIRFVGRVTRAIESLRPGAVIGLRGPYGRGWPLEHALGRDVLLVAGGLGLAPIRPAIEALLAERTRYGRLILLYGAREPSDLLYRTEYDRWRQAGMEVLTTVDRADTGWPGRVGVVPTLLRKLRLAPGQVVMMTCGPEIMMRFAIAEALGDLATDRDIYLALERNMHCAVGLCGRCQLGPEFVCKDGPVFGYPQIARFLGQKNL